MDQALLTPFRVMAAQVFYYFTTYKKYVIAEIFSPAALRGNTEENNTTEAVTPLSRARPRARRTRCKADQNQCEIGRRPFKAPRLGSKRQRVGDGKE